MSLGLRSAFEKVDVSDVVRAHTQTLFDARSEQPSTVDKVVQYVLPALVAAILAVIGVRATRTAEMLGIVSFLGGFLFALLILVLQMAATVSAETEKSGVTRRSLRRVIVLRELSANVSYAVLACLAAAGILLLGTFSVASLGWNDGLIGIFDQPGFYSFWVLFMLGHLLMTLLMILKRLSLVTTRELDLASVPPTAD